eukprot:COSAG04_NODE_245_length_18929_cov_6.708391_5_plen_547_part_00
MAAAALAAALLLPLAAGPPPPRMVRVGTGACRYRGDAAKGGHTCEQGGCNASAGVARCLGDPTCGAVDFDPRAAQCCYWRGVGADIHASEADCDTAPHPAGCACFRKDPLPPPPRPPPPPPPLGPCQTAMDCELNGACRAGVCACSPGWTGERCGQLNLVPIASRKHLGFVPSDEDQTLSCSWGGNIIREAGGQYSLVAAAMRGHCGIGAWGSNSEVVRAVASSPEGPYKYKETLVPRFSHEPNVIVAEDNKTLVMFYTACDADSGCEETALKACPKPSRFPWTTSGGSDASGTPAQATSRRPRRYSGHDQTWMRYSSSGSASGPWSPPVAVDFGNACNGKPDPYDTNFNAAILSNGSMVGLWRCVQESSAPPVIPGATVIRTMRAEHWRNTSTYTFSSVSAYPQREHGTEDPSLWIAADGSFHAILHDEDGVDPVAACTALGKHAWSSDGLSWHLSRSLAYNTTVHFQDGTPPMTLARRERPHLLVNSEGQPLVLTNVGAALLRCMPACKFVNLKRVWWLAGRAAVPESARLDLHAGAARVPEGR